MKSFEHLKSCAICNDKDIVKIANLPHFPLTGIFVKNKDIGKGINFDQGLLVCQKCGHMQLEYALNPGILYNNEYAHRSSSSHLSDSASDFTIKHIDTLSSKEKFDCILEIGCNDMILLNKLSLKGKKVFGVDPIWENKTVKTLDNVKVIGGFVEDIDLINEIGESPDLIVSTHNLEHILNPLSLVDRLLNMLSNDGIIVMEVPDSDFLVNHSRFDQVFHQHVLYFTLASFVRMISEAGGYYYSHVRNYSNWGGSLTVVFGKNKNHKLDTNPSINRLNPSEVKYKYDTYVDHMDKFRMNLEESVSPIVGYGAGQMVPAVAYYLKSDLNFLECIYDDDPSRDGLYYPNLKPRISKPEKGLIFDNFSVFITALDGVRPIMNKLYAKNPRFIFSSGNIF